MCSFMWLLPGETNLIRLESGPLVQLLDFQLILVFAVFAVLAITASLFIGKGFTHD